MDTEFSRPLVALPGFLSTISMVVDDRDAIIEQLRQAERKSPPRYGPARDLFCSALEGKFSFEEAVNQARSLADGTERKCALQVLSAAKEFLLNERRARIGLFPAMEYLLPNGLPLDISPIWLRHFAPERLMVLHFWRRPLLPRQLSAAAAVMKSALLKDRPQYASCEMDFISVPASIFGHRRFEQYNWTKLKPLNDEELARFWKQFLAAWVHYQRQGPREIKRRSSPTLFGKEFRVR